jgi:hypothetical protein
VLSSNFENLPFGTSMFVRLLGELWGARILEKRSVMDFDAELLRALTAQDSKMKP